MTSFWAIILGIVQGLTEFFPISSSAHLALFPWIFKFPDPGLAFDIALHAGSLVAIAVALWPDWIKLLKGAWEKDARSLKLVGFLLITSIPGAIFGVLLEKKAETVFRSPLLIAFDLVAFGVILWAVDHYTLGQRKIEGMKWLDSLWIGLAQAVAIIPGVSRSGATITTGQALKFNREEAVKYSFMAALPIIGGAALVGLKGVPLHEIASAPWILGFLASLVSSYFAMKFLLSYIKNKNFDVFVWWRFAVAALVIMLFLVRR